MQRGRVSLQGRGELPRPQTCHERRPPPPRCQPLVRDLWARSQLAGSGPARLTSCLPHCLFSRQTSFCFAPKIRGRGNDICQYSVVSPWELFSGGTCVSAFWAVTLAAMNR